MSCAPGESQSSISEPLVRPSSVQNVTRMDIDELENENKPINEPTSIANTSEIPAETNDPTTKRSPGVGAESPKKRQSEPITPSSIKRQLSTSVGY